MIEDPYITLFLKALECVSDDYYAIPTASSSEFCERERVFCYELYSEVRALQNTMSQLSLDIHGELDKQVHNDFPRAIKPDFIVHKAGDNSDNRLSVEMKMGLRNLSGIKKDINTLCEMTTLHFYKYGMLVFINAEMSECADFVRRVATHEKYTPPAGDALLRIFIVAKQLGCSAEIAVLADIV